MYDLLSARDSSPSGLSIAQRIAAPPIQQQYPTQVYSYGSGAQHMNASMSQPSQPPSGYPSTAAGPSYYHFYHPDTNVHTPIRNPSMHVVPLNAFTAFSPSGSTHHPQTQTYGQPLSISPVYATPVEAFSLVNDPVSSVSPYLSLATLTAFSETPNFGSWPSDSRANIRDEPTGPSQRVGPENNDKTHKKQEPELSATRKTRPVSYEGDVVRLQQRCREKGADERVLAFLGKIFADEVSLEALIRPLTDAEVETKEFGIETGKIYTAFLKYTNEASVAPRFICRLCHMQSKQTWKNSKDVLRHLRRDHFGLADVCAQCDLKFYTKSEFTRHPCKPRVTGSLKSPLHRSPSLQNQIPVADSPVHPVAGH